MNVKDAVAVARKYVSDLFADDILSPPNLEEVWFDEAEKAWAITLSLHRKPRAGLMDVLGLKSELVYKTIRVRDWDGEPVSIKNREETAI